MQLKYTIRTKEKKSELTQIRLQGNIPASIYSDGKAGDNIIIDGRTFNQILSKLPKGHLPVQRFALVSPEGQELEAVVKGIQYHPTTYKVLHLDFEQLNPDKLVRLRVPIEFYGMDKSPGLGMGGVLRKVVHHAKVKCTPENIPARLMVNVSSLNMKESVRIRDVEFPANVESLDPKVLIVGIITKR